MTTTEPKKAKANGNIFDEDITSVYTLERPARILHAYDFPVYELKNDEERYMAQAFHEQYVAVEGRTAIAHLINTRVGEISAHASFVMGQTMLETERIESVATLGRLSRRFQDYNNKLLDQTARHILETNGIAVRSIHEDMRRSIYKPPPPPPSPPRPKRKGLIQRGFELVFGEV